MFLNSSYQLSSRSPLARIQMQACEGIPDAILRGGGGAEGKRKSMVSNVCWTGLREIPFPFTYCSGKNHIKFFFTWNKKGTVAVSHSGISHRPDWHWGLRHVILSQAETHSLYFYFTVFQVNSIWQFPCF